MFLVWHCIALLIINIISFSPALGWLHWNINRNLCCFNICLFNKKKESDWQHLEAVSRTELLAVFVHEFHEFGLFSAFHINHWEKLDYENTNIPKIIFPIGMLFRAINVEKKRKIWKYNEKEKHSEEKGYIINKTMRTDRRNSKYTSFPSFQKIKHWIWMASKQASKHRHTPTSTDLMSSHMLRMLLLIFIRMHKYTLRFK